MDFAAELCAHECCFTGEGRWASGLCCCFHSFDANGCADAVCCLFAVGCTWWKHVSMAHVQETWEHTADNWNTQGTTCGGRNIIPNTTSLVGWACCCPCPCVFGGLACLGGCFRFGTRTRKRLKERLAIRSTLPDWIVALCCLPWFNFLQ